MCSFASITFEIKANNKKLSLLNVTTEAITCSRIKKQKYKEAKKEDEQHKIL